jgi:hypothetical protein
MTAAYYQLKKKTMAVAISLEKPTSTLEDGQ